MKRRNLWIGCLLGLMLVALASCATTKSSQTQTASRRDVLYTCNCGPECKCNAVSTQPGNCPCGVPMKWGHVVKIDGDTAFLCTCGEGCECAIDATDPTKCACGQPIKQVSLKGTGIYFCNCGASCYCNTVSDQPGDCKCGMPLKQVM